VDPVPLPPISVSPHHPNLELQPQNGRSEANAADANRKRIRFLTYRPDFCPWSPRSLQFPSLSEARCRRVRILSIAMMLLGYFNIFDLGLSRATVKFVARIWIQKTFTKFRMIWTSLSLLVCLESSVARVAAFFVPISVTHPLQNPPELAGQRALPSLSVWLQCRLCWAITLYVVSSRPPAL